MHKCEKRKNIELHILWKKDEGISEDVIYLVFSKLFVKHLMKSYPQINSDQLGKEHDQVDWNWLKKCKQKVMMNSNILILWTGRYHRDPS